jgi:hypothetical protein
VTKDESDKPRDERPDLPMSPSPHKQNASPILILEAIEESFFRAEDAADKILLNGKPYVAREWKAVFKSSDRIALRALEIIQTLPSHKDSLAAVPHVLRYLQMKMSVWNSLREDGHSPVFLLSLGKKGEPDLVDRMIYLYELRMKHILESEMTPNELIYALPTTISLAASRIPLDWVLAKGKAGAQFSEFARAQVVAKLMPLAKKLLFSVLADDFNSDPSNSLLARLFVMSKIRDYVYRELRPMMREGTVGVKIFLHPDQVPKLLWNNELKDLKELIELVHEFYYVKDLSFAEVLAIFQNLISEDDPEIIKLIQSVLRSYRDEGFLQKEELLKIKELQKEKKLPPFHSRDGWVI